MRRPIAIRAPSSFDWLIAGLAAIGLGLGALISRISPTLAGAALAALVFSLATLVEPVIGLGVALLIGPAKALIDIAIPGIPSDWGQLALGAALAAWFARSAARREIRIDLAPPIPAVLAFVLVAGISLLNATDLASGLTEWIKWIEIVLVASIVFAEARAGKAGWVLFVILLAGAAQAAIGIWEFGLRGTGPETFSILGKYYRAYGTFEQPNPYGGYMGLIWPVAAGLTWGLGEELWHSLRDRATRPRFTDHRRQFAAPWSLGFGPSESTAEDRLEPRPQSEPKTGLPAGVPPEGATRPPLFDSPRLRLSLALLATGVTAVMALAALGASFSRGAWLGAAAAGVMMLLFAPRRRTLGIGLILGALLAALALNATGLVPEAIRGRLADVEDFVQVRDVRGVDINDANFALVERLAHWQAAAGMAEANPWLGVGLGNYEAAYPDFRLLNWPIALGHAHNIYLNTLAETGFAGLAAYLGLWGLTFLVTIRGIRRAGGWKRGLGIGLLGAFVHLTAHHFVDNLYVNNVHLTIAALLGLAAWLPVNPNRLEKDS